MSPKMCQNEYVVDVYRFPVGAKVFFHDKKLFKLLEYIYCHRLV